MVIHRSVSFNNTGMRGTRLRAEFYILAVEQDLIEPIRHYQFFDNHTISDRTLDTCFEMYDGDLVANRIVEHGATRPDFMVKLVRDIGLVCVQQWQLRCAIAKQWNGARIGEVTIDNEFGNVTATIDGKTNMECGFIEDYNLQ